MIRADLPGVLVVQGGPGTGKTVAALHRAAYLLYTHRRAARAPRRARHRPERHVPALHRPGAARRSARPTWCCTRSATCSPACTRPTPATRPRSSRATSGWSGSCGRRSATGSGCRGRTSPSTPTAWPSRCGRAAILRARDRARATRRPHNVARKLFVTELLNELARAEARVLDRPFDDEDLPYARDRLWERAGRPRRTRRAVAAAHPGGLLADLLGSAQAIGPPPALSWIIAERDAAGSLRTTRLAGRWPTSRCSTRPPNCSASTTRRRRRRAARWSAPSAWRRSTRTRSSTTHRHRRARHDRRGDAGGWNRRQRPGARPPPSAPRPTAPGPTAT